VPTVVELSAPYENHLIPVLPAGPGVCAICHTVVVGDWPRCFKCNAAPSELPATANAVGFVALAVKGEQLARELWFYKDQRYPASTRQKPTFGLAAILWRWLAEHEPCLAEAAGTDEFPVVTTVPSTKKRAQHPLDYVVGSLIGATKDRYIPLLAAQDDDDGGCEFGEDRFRMIEPLTNGTPILLVDDTFTTGSRLQSAAAALRAANSGPVGALCIGRHFNRRPDREDYRAPAEEYYKAARARGWDWSQCCLRAH
jgi:hypothetical protein